MFDHRPSDPDNIYEYDELNRLKKAAYLDDGDQTADEQWESFSMDDLGNRQSVTIANAPQTRTTKTYAASRYGNPYLFTGRRLDTFSDTGSFEIMYYRNRYYSTYTGRFLTQDPKGYVDGLNIYEYVGGMPVIAVDPHGTFIGSAVLEWLEDRFINRFIPADDPGRDLAEELMEHYVIGIGTYDKHEGDWGDFMRERPELQAALSDKMEEIASNLCSGSSTEGEVSDSITDVKLNRLDSMRLTLHGVQTLKIEDEYEVKNPNTKCCEVVFKNVKFTWMDTGDLHPGVGTELSSGETVPDDYFASIERWLRWIPTAGPYPIEISWMGDSKWKVDTTTATVEYKWGWPHPDSEPMVESPARF